MTVAATTLLVAAAGRLSFLPAPPPGLLAMFLVWSSPVLLAIVCDLATIGMPSRQPSRSAWHYVSGLEQALADVPRGAHSQRCVISAIASSP